MRATYYGLTGKRLSEADSDHVETSSQKADGACEGVSVGINARRKKRRLTKRKFSLPLNASTPGGDPTAVEAMSVTREISPTFEPSQANVPQHLPSIANSRTLDGKNPQRSDVEVISLDDSDDTTLNNPADIPVTIDSTNTLTHLLCDDLIAKLDVYQQWLENAVLLNGESWISRYREHSRKTIRRSIANKVLQTGDLFADESEARMFEIFKTRWSTAEDRRKGAQGAQDVAIQRKRDLNEARKQLLAAHSAVKKAAAAVDEANTLSAAAEESFKESKPERRHLQRFHEQAEYTLVLQGVVICFRRDEDNDMAYVCVCGSHLACTDTLSVHVLGSTSTNRSGCAKITEELQQVRLLRKPLHDKTSPRPFNAWLIDETPLPADEAIDHQRFLDENEQELQEAMERLRKAKMDIERLRRERNRRSAYNWPYTRKSEP
ncbi:hypothetical protein EC968_005944 [Mortierella alpina]|nr:hypothetical protein EC968_005944 [Mortierella alpina]